MLVAITLQRQKRQRAVVGEALPGSPLMRLAAAHTGDDGLMQIVPFARFAASQPAHRRVGAIGGDQQGRVQLTTVVQRQLPALWHSLQPLEPGGAEQPLAATALHGLQQRVLHHPVLDDMAEHLGMHGLGGKMDLSGTRAIPDMHVGVRADASRRHPRPGAEALEDALAGCRQGADSWLEAALRVEIGGLQRARIEHQDVQPAAFECQGQRTADHSGTDDDQIGLHQLSPACRARGLSLM